jgi:chromosome segregation ATPase
MSYLFIGRGPINDTMNMAPPLEAAPGAAQQKPETHLLEAAQRQLDALRAAMDTRLVELEAALADPSRSPSLKALMLELSRLATNEAHLAATRACHQIKAECDAALLDAQSRGSTAIEAERNAAWEHRRTLDRAEKRIDELESEKHLLMQAAREQGQMADSERAARADLERIVATLENRQQDGGAQLELARETVRELSESRAHLQQNIATLRKQLEDVTDRLTAEQASVWALGREKAAVGNRMTELQLELERANKRAENEQKTARSASEERSAVSSRLASLERSLEEARLQAEEATRKLGAELEARSALDRQAAELTETLNQVRKELAAERASSSELRNELAAARTARDNERQAAATLRRAAAEVEAARAAHAEAIRERDSDRARISESERTSTIKIAELERANSSRLAELQRANAVAMAELEQAHAVKFAELERANTILRKEVDAERSSAAELRFAVSGSGEERATLLEELKRVMSAKGALEAALAQERARVASGVTTEQELRQSLKQARGETDAAKRDLAEVQCQMELAESARGDSKRAIDGFAEAIAEVERERDALSLALDTERMMAADLRAAVAKADREIAEASAEIEELRRKAQSEPAPVEGSREAAAPAAKRASTSKAKPAAASPTKPTATESEETELVFEEDQAGAATSESDRPAWTGVRAATRYTFGARLDVLVNGKPAQLLNLSTAGCGIRTAAAVEPGTKVIVQLPGKGGQICEGQVIWSRLDSFARAKTGHRSGVKFTNADPAAIEAFIILEADV